MSPWPESRLGELLRSLERHYGSPGLPAFANPFEMIVWEVVGYLADDARRETAFAALRDRVGLTPAAILGTPKGVLCEVTRLGGSIAWEDRAERLLVAARLAAESFGADLREPLRLPLPRAKKLLMQFPMIGEPGAEKILMLSGVLPVLALESNGLRVLVRWGVAEERKSYSSTYRAVREVTLAELPADARLLAGAHVLLRRHGQELCLRNGPECGACPVSAQCPANSIR